VAGGADAFNQKRARLVIGSLPRVGYGENRNFQRYELSAFVNAGHRGFSRNTVISIRLYS
jgi:hypothetical protein